MRILYEPGDLVPDAAEDDFLDAEVLVEELMAANQTGRGPRSEGSSVPDPLRVRDSVFVPTYVARTSRRASAVPLSNRPNGAAGNSATG